MNNRSEIEELAGLLKQLDASQQMELLRLTLITHAVNDNSEPDMLRVFVGGDRLALYAMMKIYIFYCIYCRYVV